MTGFSAPNYTQVPNELFPLMAHMSETELKVALHAIRETFGFHRKAAPISLSAFQKGTGLSRQGTCDGISKAVKRGILKTSGKAKYGITKWEVIIESEKSESLTSQKFRLPVVKNLDSSEHILKKVSKEKEIPVPEKKGTDNPSILPEITDSQIVAVIHAWYSNIAAPPADGKKPYANTGYRKRALIWLELGYTAEDLIRFMKGRYKPKEHIYFGTALDKAPAWLAAHPAPVALTKQDVEAVPLGLDTYVQGGTHGTSVQNGS